MGARELLRDLAGAGLSVTAEADRLVIRPASKLTDDMRAALREAKPELLAILIRPAQDRHYSLTRAEADLAHVQPWDDAACARFAARVVWFVRRGIPPTAADNLAERLHLRDLQGDDGRRCLECAHLAGHLSSGWHCRTPRAAGIGAELPEAVVLQPQRCPAFKEAASWSTP